MNIRKQISTAQDALLSGFKTSKFASESKSIIYLGSTLLGNIPHINDPVEKQDWQLALIFIGALTAALAYHQTKYASITESITISQDKDNEDYYANFYPLSWIQLLEELNISSDSIPLVEKVEENSIFDEVIKETGRRILTRELPFEKDRLIRVFPAMKASLDVIEFYIRHGIGGENDIYFPEESAETIAAAKELTVKTDFTKIHAQYPKPNTVHFFKWGPQHTERAQNVYEALMKAKDPEVMKKIVCLQLGIINGSVTAVPFELMQELQTKVGLSSRWTSAGSVVNPNLTSKEKAFELTLKEYLGAIDNAYTPVRLGFSYRSDVI